MEAGRSLDCASAVESHGVRTATRTVPLYREWYCVYELEVSHCALRAAFSCSWRTESAASMALYRRFLSSSEMPRQCVLSPNSESRSDCGAAGILGSESVPFTLAYLKLSSILNGTRMNATCADPSAAWARGSQKRPPYSP